VDKDYGEALKCYRKAADQGFAEGQFCLGCSYRDGQGVLQDFDLAAKWFKLAENQGYNKAPDQWAINEHLRAHPEAVEPRRP
jgi:TPR repeat protein